MSKNLLIVESPAKAKTIEKILGKDFQVNSCYGHIRDLEKAGMGIDIENDFEPRYIVPDEKKKVVSELKSSGKKVGRSMARNGRRPRGRSHKLASVRSAGP